MEHTIFSWNVNGLRAAYRKGFTEWVRRTRADIICVQETRATTDVLPRALTDLEGYHSFFSVPEKKGYSGVAVWTREKPRQVSDSLGKKRFDAEGRVLALEYPAFTLFNVYFPNGKASPERLTYKLSFYRHFLSHIDGLRRKGKRIIVCGDVNTAHREIDLARPKENEKISGFLPEERAWIDSLIAHGFHDALRLFHSEAGLYTWWDVKTRARERNVGWRLDYFFISDSLKNRVTSCRTFPEIPGSDHCPVGLTLSA